MLSAYLLVSHGSRDPRPNIAMEQLAKLLGQKLVTGDQNLLRFATLEFAPQPLHQQILEFARQVLALGCDRIKILPLFLASGIHLTIDIPTEIVLAQQAIDRQITKPIKIDLQPYLGSHSDLGKLFSATMVNFPGYAVIVLAHGSRRPDSNLSIEAIAANLGATAAYWSVNPTLLSRIQELVAAGHQKIVVLPYFLFSGSITDAIAKVIGELQLDFPHVTLELAEPLGATPELAELIWDLAVV